MNVIGTNNLWRLSYGFNISVDFCIWILEEQGLQISPFDEHSSKDSALKEKGMNAENWRSWLAEVAVSPYDVPSNLWRGEPTVGEQLSTLWESYGPISNKRKAWEPKLGKNWAKELTSWNELQPYQKSLDSLTIYFADYVTEIDYIIPPTFAVLTVVNGQLDSNTLRTRVLNVAEKLVTNKKSS